MLSRGRFSISSLRAKDAARVLQAGGLVVLPTDTVYGVAVDAGNVDAVRRLYEAKGRGETKPLQVLLADISWLPLVAKDLNPSAQRLAERFFPGGITLVLRKTDLVPGEAVSGGRTVGVRVPGHEGCRDVLRAFGRPLAASSANRSGGLSPRTAAEAEEQLGDAVDLIIDAGPAPLGRDSTVIDATVEPVHILREGAVAREKIAAALADLGGCV
jgi:L-threonylcarbamoyladenylate synthase